MKNNASWLTLLQPCTHSVHATTRPITTQAFAYNSADTVPKLPKAIARSRLQCDPFWFHGSLFCSCISVVNEKASRPTYPVLAPVR